MEIWTHISSVYVKSGRPRLCNYAEFRFPQVRFKSDARAVTRTPRHHHITPVLKSLHWLKIPERIHFKVLSLTYNSLQSSQPTYLRELFTIQPTRSSNTPTLTHLIIPLPISTTPTLTATLSPPDTLEIGPELLLTPLCKPPLIRRSARE